MNNNMHSTNTNVEVENVNNILNKNNNATVTVADNIKEESNMEIMKINGTSEVTKAEDVLANDNADASMETFTETLLTVLSVVIGYFACLTTTNYGVFPCVSVVKQIIAALIHKGEPAFVNLFLDNAVFMASYGNLGKATDEDYRNKYYVFSKSVHQMFFTKGKVNCAEASKILCEYLSCGVFDAYEVMLNNRNKVMYFKPLTLIHLNNKYSFIYADSKKPVDHKINPELLRVGISAKGWKMILPKEGKHLSEYLGHSCRLYRNMKVNEPLATDIRNSFEYVMRAHKNELNIINAALKLNKIGKEETTGNNTNADNDNVPNYQG